MSKTDSRKELAGVYKRCLSALIQGYAINRHPSPEWCKRAEKRVAKEAAAVCKSSTPFKSDEEGTSWVKKRFGQLYSFEMARLATDPRTAARETIQQLSQLL